MADNKRNSVAGKVATPNLKAGPGSNKDVIGADSDLYKAVGSRIKVTCAPGKNVLEGTLFTACNLTHAIAINTAPAPPNPSPASLFSQPGDYHIIPFAHIESFEIIGTGERVAESAAGFDGALPSISKVDLAALQAREDQTIREMKKKDMQKGKGVSAEAQELFDAISRTLPTRWADTQIVVNDSVLIQAPYTLDSIKAPADKHQAKAHVRKVVEAFYQRKKGASAGGAARAPVAVPNAPRKGAAKGLNDIRNKWKHAPVTVRFLCSQLKLNGTLLSRLQALLLDETNAVHADPDLVDTLDTTLRSSLVLGVCLGKYVSKIMKGVHGDGSMSSKAKFWTLWNEDEAKDLLERLHQNHTAINMLIGPLNRDSSTERKKLLQEKEQSKTMSTMNEHTQHMRKAYALTVAESTFKTEDSPDGLSSNLSTLVDPTDDSSEQHFESVLSNSRVYKKASNAAMSRRPHTDFDNASMRTNHSTTATIGDPDFITDPSNTEEDTATTRPIIVHICDPVHRASKNLNVAGVTGICTESYPTQEPGKLSYKPHDRIQNLRKVDAAWWFGNTELSENVPDKSGIILRRDFYPVYRLDEWKSAHTGRSMGTEAVGECWLRYEEGDRVEFNEL
ncbi:hypothetical protein J4E81_011026 [Alternaria sp. BMP 2799]|nr:hypothetical protein J4E81_011026 [Alternaria sp. BMP 2799]